MVKLTPQAFAEKWSGTALSERSSYQQQFLDLCAMVGAPTPAEVDPTGGFYTFEKGVEKTGGGKGFADVWYRDCCAAEYKEKHKDRLVRLWGWRLGGAVGVSLESNHRAKSVLLALGV